jgi:hypothetical protein
MVIQASTVRALLRMRRYWRRLCKPSYKDRSGGSLAFMHTFSHYQEKKIPGRCKGMQQASETESRELRWTLGASLV